LHFKGCFLGPGGKVLEIESQEEAKNEFHDRRR
jgi:hypothetical protein